MPKVIDLFPTFPERSQLALVTDVIRHGDDLIIVKFTRRLSDREMVIFHDLISNFILDLPDE